MAALAARLFCVLALAAAASAAVPATVSTCSWYAYDPNIAFAGYCYTNPNYYIAISKEPTTYVGKMLTRVMGRTFLCGQLRTAKDCAAKAPAWGCSWGGQPGGSGNSCSAAEYSRWRWFTTHTYFEEAPSWIQACPGSPTAAALTCSGAGTNASACTKSQVCYFDSTTKSCDAKALKGLNSTQREAFYDKMRKVDPSVAGSCAATCYLRQVLACAAPPASIEGNATATAKWCNAQPYCSWQDGYCRAQLYGPDAWGKDAAAAQGACSAFGDSGKCTRGRQATVQAARIARYINYPSPAELVPVKCPV